MKKRSKLIFTLFVLVLLSALSLSVAAEDVTKIVCQVHQNIEFLPAVTPTCENFGLTEGAVCKDCGETIISQVVIPATGHRDDNADLLCDFCGLSLIEKKRVSALKADSSAAKKNSVALFWSALPGADGYEVFTVDKKSGAQKFLSSTASASLTVKSLSPNSTYSFTVRAYKLLNGKKHFSLSSPPTEAHTSVLSPTGLSLSKPTSTSLKLRWNKSNGATGYTIYYRAAKTKGEWLKVKSVKATSATVKKLSSGTSYQFRVRAYKKIAGETIVSSASKSAKASTLSVKRICIVAGHGSRRSGVYDPGATFKSYEEHLLATDIAKYAAQYYNKTYNEQCDVLNLDGEMLLKDKKKALNRGGYEMAAEIHFNVGQGSGCEVYYPKASAEGKQYAKAISRSISKQLGFTNRGAKTLTNEKGKDYFFIIRETKPVTLLVETAFIDNTSDMKKLNTKKKRKNCAIAIAKAIAKVRKADKK